MLLSFLLQYQPSILWMGVATVTKCVVNACSSIQRRCYISHSFHSKRCYNSHVVATRLSASVSRGEWVNAQQSKPRLQLYSINFALKQRYNSFISKLLKCIALKFIVACVAMHALVMNTYSHNLLVLSLYIITVASKLTVISTCSTWFLDGNKSTC